MKVIKVKKDGSITLPRELLKLFPSVSELAFWSRGDTIILKRLTPFKPTEFAERVSEVEMPIEEIVGEIHRLRKEKKDG